jgi:hypothetical protein
MPPAIAWRALAGIAAVVVLWGLYAFGKHEGRAEEREKNLAAIGELQVRVATQMVRDAQVNEESVDDLEAELDRLRGAAPLGPVRVCLDTPRRPGPVPAVPSLAAGAGFAGVAGGDRDGVREGTGTGVDIGPGLQRLAEAYDVRNAQVRALLERNRKLSELAATTAP